MSTQFNTAVIKANLAQFDLILDQSMRQAVLVLQQAVDYLNQAQNRVLIENALHPFVRKINEFIKARQKAKPIEELMYSEPMTFSEVLVCREVFYLAPNALPFCVDEKAVDKLSELIRYTQLEDVQCYEFLSGNDKLDMVKILRNVEVTAFSLWQFNGSRLITWLKPTYSLISECLDNPEYSSMFELYISLINNCEQSLQKELFTTINKRLDNVSYLAKLVNHPRLMEILIQHIDCVDFDDDKLDYEFTQKMRLVHNLSSLPSLEHSYNSFCYFAGELIISTLSTCSKDDFVDMFSRLHSTLSTLEPIYIEQAKRFNGDEKFAVKGIKSLFKDVFNLILSNALESYLTKKRKTLNGAARGLFYVLKDLEQHIRYNEQHNWNNYSTLEIDCVKALLEQFAKHCETILVLYPIKEVHNFIEFLIKNEVADIDIKELLNIAQERNDFEQAFKPALERIAQSVKKARDTLEQHPDIVELIQQEQTEKLFSRNKTQALLKAIGL